MPVCVRLRRPAGLWPGHVVVRVRSLWQDQVGREAAGRAAGKEAEVVFGRPCFLRRREVRERNRLLARADGRSHRARTEDSHSHSHSHSNFSWTILSKGERCSEANPM